MIERIIGWFLIIWGLIILIRPEFFRAKLTKKAYKKIRWTLLFFFIGLISPLFSVVGIIKWALLRWVVYLLILVGLMYLFFKSTRKAYEQIVSLVQLLPVPVLRGIGLFYLILGLFMAHIVRLPFGR